jgi:short subunit dehydrogenase-like uncharacterized protein
MDRLGTIAVLGATGFTGQRVVEALERYGQPYVALGRRPDALARVAGPHCRETRLVDVTDQKSVVRAFEGVAAVVNTVGPFARVGAEVVRAALEAGVHLTDVSAEVAWLRRVGGWHAEAEEQGVCLVPGNGCDFGFAHLAAVLADDAVGGAERLAFHQAMEDFVPSGGTLHSIVAQGRERPVVRRGGEVLPIDGLGIHRKLAGTLDGWAVPWPGAEPYTLVWDLPHVGEVSCHLVLSLPEAMGFAMGTRVLARLPQAGLDRLGRLVARAPDVPERRRTAARFTLLAEATRGDAVARVQIEAPDVYGITGDLAAVTACLLARGEARDAGVRTVGGALDPTAVLAALAPRGVEARSFLPLDVAA